MRHFTDKKLLIASHNAGKLVEIPDFLKNTGVECLSASQFNVPEPEETEPTFTGNAILKAKHAVETTGLPALGDDTGLVVPALDGQPGIYSARWAGPEKDFPKACQRIKDELEGRGLGSEGHSAYFVCVLALAWPDGHVETFEGQVHGTLVFPGCGNLGFGYDPIFVVEGHTVTVGEMTPSEKKKISHRNAAFQKLLQACFVS